jgi:hypothetical protein
LISSEAVHDQEAKMAAIQEMTHPEFVDVVEQITAMGRRVGLWPPGMEVTDEPRPRRWFWQRRHIDHARIVVYVRRAHRDPKNVVRDIRRAIVRHGSGQLSPNDKIVRAAALRRLTERGMSC